MQLRVSIEPEIKYEGFGGRALCRWGFIKFGPTRFLRCNKYKNINAAAASILIHPSPRNPFQSISRFLSADKNRRSFDMFVGRFLSADKNRPIFIVRLTAASLGFRFTGEKINRFAHP